MKDSGQLKFDNKHFVFQFSKSGFKTTSYKNSNITKLFFFQTELETVVLQNLRFRSIEMKSKIFKRKNCRSSIIFTSGLAKPSRFHVSQKIIFLSLF